MDHTQQLDHKGRVERHKITQLHFKANQKPISKLLSLSSMASRKIFHAKLPNYIYPTSEADTKENHFEFDEADLWNSNEVSSSLETKKPIPTSRSAKKHAKKIDIGDRTPVTSSSSVPMNIPDWSKILKEDYREHQRRDSDEDFDEDNDGDDQDDRVPPHEYLARRRGASFSVHEGIGRTLKGRDLRRVRNAIWKKVGFED